MGTDMAELVNESTSTDYGVVVDNYLTGNLSAIRHNHVVAYANVVGDVRIRHNETVVSHNGLAFGGSTAIHGNALAQSGVVADNCNSILTVKLEVLRNSRDNSTGEN